MTERIVEKSLRKVVEEPGICCWLDKERSFDRSKCLEINPKCLGDNEGCKYYSYQKIHRLKNGRIIEGSSDSFPDYLL